MKYLYFKLWQDFTGQIKDNTPALYAMMWLSCINCVYLIAFMVLTNHFIKLKLLYVSKNELIIYSSILSLIVMLLNYFLLYKKRESIAEKYSNESKHNNILGKILLYLYMIGAFVIVYIISKTFPIK